MKTFDERVRSTSTGCMEWIGKRNQKGYGLVHQPGGAYLMAHRISYERAVGPIPDGLVIDHLCRNHSCVNPAHLEPVTSAENTRRSELTMASINAAKTHCKRGHEFTPANTWRRTSGRRCKACAQNPLTRSSS